MCAAVLLTGKTTPPAGMGVGGNGCQAKRKCAARRATSPGGGSGRRAKTARAPATPRTASRTGRLGYFTECLSIRNQDPTASKGAWQPLAIKRGESVYRVLRIPKNESYVTIKRLQLK